VPKIVVAFVRLKDGHSRYCLSIMLGVGSSVAALSNSKRFLGVGKSVEKRRTRGVQQSIETRSNRMAT